IYKEIATTMLDTGSWGVDINPIKPLMSEGNYFAGGISYFDDSNGVEIAVPINYVKFSDSRSDYYGFDSKYNYDEIDFTLDLHIRKFSTNKVSGVFLGLFGRYTYLEGKLKDEDRLATQHKFGLGVEIGIRIRDIFNLPLYWGMSVAIGQYFGKSHNIFYSDNCIALEMDDEETFFDGELLKIGYEF
ncbi:MAG: hypothetical protein U9P38_04795, partial [Campylobacterota bacterium]|nr:hypothetical protein [Campylobacterota bacterium]